jgi:hypothetical protein
MANEYRWHDALGIIRDLGIVGRAPSASDPGGVAFPAVLHGETFAGAGKIPGIAATVGAGDRDLLAEVRSGQDVRLAIEFRAFQQIEGESNRNYLRFKRGILNKLAKSFKGMPLLRDHQQGDLTARAGTITSSVPVAIEGGTAFDMAGILTAPWAVEAALLGNLDRFSIGWSHPGMQSIECSACGCGIFTECSHFPGDTIEGKDGEKSTVEFIFTEAEGVEVSAVSVPAVQGTQITEIRSALSTWAGLRSAEQTRKHRERAMLNEIAKRLGLGDTATADDIGAALDARAVSAQAAEAEVARLQSEHAKLSEAVAVLQRASNQRELDALFTEFADRFPRARNEAGSSVRSAAEENIRGLVAGKDAMTVRQILASLPVLSAVIGLQSAPGGAAEPVAPSDRPAGHPLHIPWNPQLEKTLRELGQSYESYLKFGPHNGPMLTTIR